MKEIFKKLEHSKNIFKERLNEVQCDKNEFKYILESIYYLIRLSLKTNHLLIEKIVNNLSYIKTLCNWFGGFH